MRQLNAVTAEFVQLTTKKCKDEQFDKLLDQLLPMPTKPRNMERNPGLKKAYEAKVADIEETRKGIRGLRKVGKGMDKEGANGTLWGALNAITECVDHHKVVKGGRLSYALLGTGMDIKMKAYRLIQEGAKKAA